MKAVAQVLTFRELDAIRGALLDDMARTDLPIDTEPMKETLLKIDGVMDKYCRTRQYDAFAFLPLLAESDEE